MQKKYYNIIDMSISLLLIIRKFPEFKHNEIIQNAETGIVQIHILGHSDLYPYLNETLRYEPASVTFPKFLVANRDILNNIVTLFNHIVDQTDDPVWELMRVEHGLNYIIHVICDTLQSNIFNKLLDAYMQFHKGRIKGQMKELLAYYKTYVYQYQDGYMSLYYLPNETYLKHIEQIRPLINENKHYRTPQICECFIVIYDFLIAIFEVLRSDPTLKIDDNIYNIDVKIIKE